jgi:hypothetical protein
LVEELVLMKKAGGDGEKAERRVKVAPAAICLLRDFEFLRQHPFPEHIINPALLIILSVWNSQEAMEMSFTTGHTVR